MNNAVNLFRLNSGEEVIAECDIAYCAVDERGRRCYEIKSPIIMLPMGNGEIGLAPLLPYCEGKSFMLPETSVMFHAVPQKPLREKYLSAVSGIVVPDPAVSHNLRLITD